MSFYEFQMVKKKCIITDTNISNHNRLDDQLMTMYYSPNLINKIYCSKLNQQKNYLFLSLATTNMINQLKGKQKNKEKKP